VITLDVKVDKTMNDSFCKDTLIILNFLIAGFHIYRRGIDNNNKTLTPNGAKEMNE
jgi:hypothetical protein